MKLLDQSAQTNWKFIAIVAFVAVFLAGGILMLTPKLNESLEPLPQQNTSQIDTSGPVLSPSTELGINSVEGWQTYRNDEFRFLFSYPENRFPYFSEGVDPYEQLYLFILPAAELESLGLTDVWISILVLLYSPNFTLDEYLTLHEDPEYYKDAKREPIEIGGEQGYKITKYPRITHEEPFSYVAQVKRGKYVYKLDLVTFLEETLLANEELFDQILATFQFMESEIENTLKPADAQFPAAGACAGPLSGDLAAIVLKRTLDNIPVPRCLLVRGDQRLQIKNATDESITVTLGRVQMTIEPGETQADSRAFNSYLASGVHHVSRSPLRLEVPAPEIWLQ